MQFRVIVVTDQTTHTHPQTRPITIRCAAARAQCNDGLEFIPAYCLEIS